MNKINSVKIKLIIGLGNPGEEYKNTRHNTGFIFVDELAKKYDTSEFKYDKKMNTEITEALRSEALRSPTSKFPRSRTSTEIGLRLAKPQAFMNKSGIAVSALSKFYKIKPENILVVHDDIDILWKQFKLSFGRSSAGHKGVESIIKSLKTKDFWRLRVGIQPKTATSDKRQATRIKADKIILKKFTPAEEKTLKSTIKSAIEQIEETIM